MPNIDLTIISMPNSTCGIDEFPWFPVGTMWIVAAADGACVELQSVRAALQQRDAAVLDSVPRQHQGFVNQRRAADDSLRHFEIRFHEHTLLTGDFPTNSSKIFFHSQPFLGGFTALQELTCSSRSEACAARAGCVIAVRDIAEDEVTTRIANAVPVLLGEASNPLNRLRNAKTIPLMPSGTGYAIGGFLAKRAIAKMRKQHRLAPT